MHVLLLGRGQGEMKFRGHPFTLIVFASNPLGSFT